MVDVNVGGGGPGGTVEGRVPGAGGGGAVAANYDGGAITLEYGLARVAGAGDGDPVVEEVTGDVKMGSYGEEVEGVYTGCSQ